MSAAKEGESRVLRRIEDPLLARSNRSPHVHAVVEGDRSCSYGELATRARGLAAQLVRRGVEPGDRVAIAEAAVRGVPDPVAGQVIVAHVVPRDPGAFSTQELMAFCRREMPSYMVPRAVHAHASLPRTASGKLDRKSIA